MLILTLRIASGRQFSCRQNAEEKGPGLEFINFQVEPQANGMVGL